jgi:hypothetical protein
MQLDSDVNALFMYANECAVVCGVLRLGFLDSVSVLYLYPPHLYHIATYLLHV